MAFENDVAAAASVLNVFSRNTAQQQLLENSVLKSIVDSIGGSPVLYNTAVGYILERYIATGHPRLASLRLHLLQYHLQPSQQSTPSGRQVLRPPLVAHLSPMRASTDRLAAWRCVCSATDGLGCLDVACDGGAGSFAMNSW